MRGSGSGLNSEWSPEHSDMEPPAEMPCLCLEKGFVLGEHLHRCLKTREEWCCKLDTLLRGRRLWSNLIFIMLETC